jgi:hypothetical protein
MLVTRRAWIAAAGSMMIACQRKLVRRLTYRIELDPGSPLTVLQALVQARPVVYERLTDLGILGPKVDFNGDTLVVALPALDDHLLAAAKWALGRRGRVGFTIVDDETDVFAGLPETPSATGIAFEQESVRVGAGFAQRRYATTAIRAGESPDEACARLQAYVRGVALPASRVFALERQFAASSPNHQDSWRSYVLVEPSALANEDVAAASQIITGLLVSFKHAGAEKLATLTRANVHRRLAVAVDGVVVAVMMIESPIEGGHALVSGSAGPHGKEGVVRLEMFLRGKPMPVALSLVADDAIR